MKYVIVLAVILAVVWWTFGRRPPPTKPPGERDASSADNDRQGVVTPLPMLVCAHCGVHLPPAEAVLDAAERPFCSEAHRLAGPRA